MRLFLLSTLCFLLALAQQNNMDQPPPPNAGEGPQPGGAAPSNVLPGGPQPGGPAPPNVQPGGVPPSNNAQPPQANAGVSNSAGAPSQPAVNPFARGKPESYKFNLCDVSADVKCDNDLVCLRVASLRNSSDAKSTFRCVNGTCRKADCLLDSDCKDSEYCSSTGTCSPITFVNKGETCRPEQTILCQPPLQCNMHTKKCDDGLKEGDKCDMTGASLWPPCPKDFTCLQWDSNSTRCLKQVMYLRQLGDTCSRSSVADPFTKCAEGLACVGGICKNEVVPVAQAKGIQCSGQCTNNKECVTHICYQGSCVERALLVGESCKVNDQCLSGQCAKGVCTGTDCSTTQCDNGKICSFDRNQRKFTCVEDPAKCSDEERMIYVVDKCVMKPTEGQDCDILGVPCVDPLHCDFTQKKCVKSDTVDQPCAWNEGPMDNCTLLGKEACQCTDSQPRCKVIDPAKILADRVPNSGRCIEFTTKNSPLFNACVRELSLYAPASTLYDVASRDLPNCKKYWATFYCCSICMGVALDQVNGEDMSEKIQTYLPGLQCQPDAEWNPKFIANEDSKCILDGFLEPKSRDWYKNELCGNFLQDFNSKPSGREQPISGDVDSSSRGGKSRGRDSNAVPTQSTVTPNTQIPGGSQTQEQPSTSVSQGGQQPSTSPSTGAQQPQTSGTGGGVQQGSTVGQQGSTVGQQPQTQPQVQTQPSNIHSSSDSLNSNVSLVNLILLVLPGLFLQLAS